MGYQLLYLFYQFRLLELSDKKLFANLYQPAPLSVFNKPKPEEPNFALYTKLKILMNWVSQKVIYCIEHDDGTGWIKAQWGNKGRFNPC